MTEHWLLTVYLAGVLPFLYVAIEAAKTGTEDTILSVLLLSFFWPLFSMLLAMDALVKVLSSKEEPDDLS